MNNKDECVQPIVANGWGNVCADSILMRWCATGPRALMPWYADKMEGNKDDNEDQSRPNKEND